MASYSAPVASPGPGPQMGINHKQRMPFTGLMLRHDDVKESSPHNAHTTSKLQGGWCLVGYLMWCTTACCTVKGAGRAGHQSWSCNPPRILGRAQRKGPITFTCSPSLFPRLRCIFSIYLPITSRTFTSFTPAYPVVNTAYSLLSFLSLSSLCHLKKKLNASMLLQTRQRGKNYNKYSYIYIYEVWSCKQYMPRHHPT